MIPQAKDEKIFKELLRTLNKKENLKESPSQLIIKIGRHFLGKPYQSGSLETNQTERVLINPRGFDCVTFIEYVLALALLLKSRRRSLKSFQRILRRIRYREGRLKGYPSHLHYFSDWIYDNQKKGFLRDITSEIGGRPFRKSIHYMTSNPELYPPLKNPSIFQAIKSLERRIRRRALFLIPKKEVRRLEGRVGDGDLIAITTSREGLDIAHVGLAVKVKNRIHLLHASSNEGKVILSKKTLDQYLMEHRDYSGIMVARFSF
ncbi:MAG: N-acetylmuramoyl-L-alanine amidase-like domain-containing protein [Thermodesulfobacteriota bacterium]